MRYLWRRDDAVYRERRSVSVLQVHQSPQQREPCLHQRQHPYLNLLIDEIRIVDNQATIKGSYDALAATIHQIKTGTDQVPTFIHDWRARLDSNQ